MDTGIRKKILLGLFVTVGIILFLVGIFFIGSKNELFDKTFPVTARFSNAGGLKIGSNVRFNGVKVGIVKKVSIISDTLVQVEMQIEQSKRQFITINSMASIASDGLMGDKLISITPGIPGGALVQDNEEIMSHNSINMDEMMGTLNESNKNVKTITDNLKTLTNDLNTENGTIQSLYKDPEMANNLKSSFSNLNAVTYKVLNVSNSLHIITNQIQNGNGAMGELINDTALGRSLVNTMSNLKSTSEELNMVSGQLSATMTQVNSGKGPMNTLLTDTALSNNIQQSMFNIKAATGKLDQDLEGLKHTFLLRRYFRKMQESQRDTVKR